MDNEQARFLLGASRPGGADARDPEIAAAEAQARLDPALGKWLAEERSFDAAIARHMQALEPPASLRARISAGARVSGRQRTSIWRHGAFIWGLGVAAALVIAAGVVWLIPRGETPAPQIVERPSLVEWKEACLSIFAAPDFGLDFMNEQYPPLEHYLREHGTTVAGQLPFKDGVLFPVGCKVLEWRGLPVSFTCFRTAEHQLVHLFVVRRGVADESTIARGPAREQVGEFSSVTWLREDRIILVASPMPAEGLEQVLGAALVAGEARSDVVRVLGTLGTRR